ncbi:NADH-quinone oxidoreductase subunit C [endosymbiont of Lamellibrachia barhami]|uniref:NADH-quinone oxidoreductase subunit C n=1 Tax=endosymbiont of Lamellibrachia barhami TaxID=205975 RepID=UPI001FE6366B|nr:NADH-quinone oxidoreductase subunit C [endosymbiont of Lamellibrachia barhami]
MSKTVTPWLDNLLQEIEGIEIRRKDSRRVRIDIAADSLPTLLELLRGRAGYVHLSAITCVDWIDERQFELVYQLWSYESQSLVSAHIRIAREPGVYVSVFDLYQPAAFFERDIHEMFGVYFEGSRHGNKFIAPVETAAADAQGSMRAVEQRDLRGGRTINGLAEGDPRAGWRDRQDA